MGMSMFQDTVTIYNKYAAGGEEKWKRTVLRGVFWSSVEGAVLRRTGAASADSVVVLIPGAVAGYVKPKAWDALTEKGDSWTLRPGDTMARGDVPTEIVRSTRELDGLDDVLTVTTVDDRRFGGLPHLEVSGK